MSATPATIRGNIGWFAGIYVLGVLALVAVFVALSFVGLVLPNGASIGVNVVVFIAVVNAAGGRFANSDAEWTRENRTRLAFGYVVAAMIVSLLLSTVGLVVFVAAAPNFAAALQSEVGAAGLGILAGIMAVVLLILAAMYYLGARFVLGRIEPGSSR